MQENFNFKNNIELEEQKRAELNKFWRDPNYFLEIDGEKLTLKECYLRALARSKEVFQKTKESFEQIPKDKFILYVNQTEKGMMQNESIKYIDKDRLELINEAETGSKNPEENFNIANIKYCLGVENTDPRFKVFNSYNDDLNNLDLSNCIGVVFSGGEAFIKDEVNPKRIEMISKSTEIAKEIQRKSIPTLGICFGAQLLASIDGAKVDWVSEEKKEQQGITGVYQIESIDENKLPNKLYIAENHAQEIILENGNPNILARNKDQGLEVFMLNENTLCTQGHPEVGSNRLDLGLDLNKKDDNKEIIFSNNLEKTREYFFIEFLKNAGKYNKEKSA